MPAPPALRLKFINADGLRVGLDEPVVGLALVERWESHISDESAPGPNAKDYYRCVEPLNVQDGAIDIEESANMVIFWARGEQ
jgi:hypothetical protein